MANAAAIWNGSSLALANANLPQQNSAVGHPHPGQDP
jgi:hypothetical protein